MDLLVAVAVAVAVGVGRRVGLWVGGVLRTCCDRRVAQKIDLLGNGSGIVLTTLMII